MKCPYCGAHIRKSDKFCARCGKTVNIPDAVKDPWYLDEPDRANDPDQVNGPEIKDSIFSGAGMDEDDLDNPYEEHLYRDSFEDDREKGTHARTVSVVVLFFVAAAAAIFLVIYFHPGFIDNFIMRLPGLGGAEVQSEEPVIISQTGARSGAAGTGENGVLTEKEIISV